MRRALPTFIAVSAVTALAVSALPATAATSAASRWHVVYRHRFAAGSFSMFQAIRPGGPNEIWAVGGYGAAANGIAGAVLRKDGHWRVTPVPKPVTLGVMTAVSAVSASEAWAVTANGYVIRWDGARWRVARHLAEPNEGPPGEVPTGVLALSARNVWVFYPTFRGLDGSLHGGTQHYLNGKWHQVTGRARSIIAVSEATPSQLWAVARSGSRVNLLRYRRPHWRPVSVPRSAGLVFANVLALRNGVVWALAWPSTGTGAGTLLKLAHGHWSRHPLPKGIQPGPLSTHTDLASDGHGGVYIAAPAFYPHGGHLLHFAGHSWQQVDLAANVNAVSVLAVPHSNVICAAGQAANYTTNSGTALVWSTGSAC
jgi:hypothetical protein